MSDVRVQVQIQLTRDAYRHWERIAASRRLTVGELLSAKAQAIQPAPARPAPRTTIRDAEADRIRQLRASGLSYAAIAARTGRHPNSIRTVILRSAA